MIGKTVPSGDKRLIGDEDYRNALSEDLTTTLNLATWERGWDIERLISRIRSQAESAESASKRIRATVRHEIFPELKNHPRIREAGVYEAHPDWIRTVFESLLFPGRVEAVNSIVASHDSLALGITQIGIAVAGYGGLSGTFSQRLFRKDMSTRTGDALQEAMECIEARQSRSHMGRQDNLSKLVRRSIRAYAERAILLDRSKVEWRMGQGNPCSSEMISGSGYPSLLRASLGLLRRLIQGHKKFVFVSQALNDRGYLTLGDALKAGEYAIVQSLDVEASSFVANWEDYDDGTRDEAADFVSECCPDVLIGLFKASETALPRLFYAHREHVHIAAHIALADSLVSPERGFPMLLDVADASCRGVFGSESFLGLVQDAYTRAGMKVHYFGER